MSNMNRRLAWRRSAGEVDETGFTLIELLIVIVVLGILAAIVVFALGGVSNQATVSACNSDARTVNIAVQAYLAENPGGTPTGGATGDLVPSYLGSWPTNSNYSIGIAAGGEALHGGGTASANDVLVTITSTGYVYDYNTSPSTACSSA